jgi:hypothetical protein
MINFQWCCSFKYATHQQDVCIRLTSLFMANNIVGVILDYSELSRVWSKVCMPYSLYCMLRIVMSRERKD